MRIIERVRCTTGLAGDNLRDALRRHCPWYLHERQHRLVWCAAVNAVCGPSAQQLRAREKRRAAAERARELRRAAAIEDERRHGIRTLFDETPC